MKAQVLLWFSLYALGSAAGVAKKSGAGEMMKKIQEIGIENEINALYANQEQWKKLLSGISKADSAWISVGLVLYDSADAAASDAITQSLGEALEINPAKVFQQLRSPDMIPAICAAPDVHVTKYNSYVKTMKAVEKRSLYRIAGKGQGWRPQVFPEVTRLVLFQPIIDLKSADSFKVLGITGYQGLGLFKRCRSDKNVRIRQKLTFFF